MNKETIIKRLEELKKMVEEGKTVMVSDIVVRKLEYEITKRGAVMVVINDGELVDYATRIFVQRRIVVK
jgi:ribosomal protein S6